MKKTILLTGMLMLFSLTNSFLLSQIEDLKDLKYFKVLVTTSDDEIFSMLQDDMGIDPKLQSYTIFVDIRETNIKDQFIVLGDINDKSSVKFSWMQMSEKVRNGLVNWSKPNKMKAE